MKKASKNSNLHIRCTEEWKEDLKASAEARGIDVTSYVKIAVYEQQKRDRRK